ncbi:Thymidylate synthase [Dirofilaria immitis]
MEQHLPTFSDHQADISRGFPLLVHRLVTFSTQALLSIGLVKICLSSQKKYRINKLGNQNFSRWNQTCF